MQLLRRTLAIMLALVLFVIPLASCAKNNDDTPDVDYIGGELLDGVETRYVKWEGRYEYKQATEQQEAQVALYHTATGFTVEFYGTQLQVKFFHQNTPNGGSDIYYNVAVDDETLPNANPARTFCLPDEEMTKTVTLVEGLEEGKHTVTCLKMDEPKDAYTAVISLETDGGFYERDAEIDNSRIKFMFVCASGGSGFGSLAYTTSGGVARTRANSSSLHSFNYLTARMFNADVQFVAQGGWGLSYPTYRSIAEVMDYTGITTSNNVNGAKATALWQHSKWVPDVIIFNIGGNDTTFTGDSQSSAFNKSVYQQGAVDIVNKLHLLYPNAVMIWTHTDSNAGSYAISALTSAGITRNNWFAEVIIPKVGVGPTTSNTYSLTEEEVITLVYPAIGATSDDDAVYGQGASNHNSFKTHIATAEILAKQLRKWGFVSVNTNVVFDNYLALLDIP